MDLATLKERQGWTLHQKVDHSLGVIDEFLSKTNGKAYVAFSGGKDSTVLLYLCRLIDPSIPAVFSNTGCEYPDIVKFVRKINEEWGNVITIHPKMPPRQVWEKYGFPLVSKEVAHQIHTIRNTPDGITAKKLLDPGNYFKLAKRWQYLIDAPYDTSDYCCVVLKKQPSHIYEKETGRSPIIGTMASESQLRQKTYIRRGGCNVFEGKRGASSLPLSIWTDDDIWAFIKERGIPYADIYNKGVERTGCVCCGFGAGDSRDYRIRVLHDLYPKYYKTVLNFTNNGVTYRKALKEMFYAYRRYLPDEMPRWLTHTVYE